MSALGVSNIVAPTNPQTSVATTESSISAVVSTASTSEEKAASPSLSSGIPGIVLPSTCSFVQVNGNNTIALCEPPAQTAWEKFFTPALALSLIAIVLSIISLRYTKSKDLNARQQSIYDDFWLRKIVSPLSIEPFFKYGTDLAGSLPIASSATIEQVQNYWLEQQKKISGFYSAFNSLLLIEGNLATQVEKKLEQFEDCLATHIGDLQQHLKNPDHPTPSNVATIGELNGYMFDIFKLIQTQQFKIKSVSTSTKRNWLRSIF